MSVGRAIPHDSARAHVTGRARFLDDLPRLDRELQVTFVGAPCARGRLVSIDASQALLEPGVVAVLTAADIPGHNRFGPVIADEPFLADDEIHYLGQPLAVIAAETAEAAAAARRKVAVEVVEEAPILGLDKALEARQFLGPERAIRRGDLGVGWAESRHRIAGTLDCKGQEQFYFESQAALAVPGEWGEIWVHSSTQNPTEIQRVVAEGLGLGQHQVVCECKRMGGAFGGKETQAAIPAWMAALVAQRCGRPARVVYSKDDDMRVTGKRHAYRTSYRAGFDDDGRITALELDFFSDGGAFLDLSLAVLERTLLHADNAYYLPHVAVTGRVCRTNTPPNTAFRGFGGPQAVLAIENVVEEISIHLGKDPAEVRRINLYDPDEASARARTHYGQLVSGNLLPEILERLSRACDYQARRASAIALNRQSRTALRGVAMTPVKFGISFTNRTLNQANALVNVYVDGSVQVSTGATEMGQGVNTKIAQLVADGLGVLVETVTVMTTSTEKNNNTSPTAASASTDLNGSAALRACSEIRGRLADLAAQRFADPAAGLAADREAVRFDQGEVWDSRAPDRRMSFAGLTELAHRERVDLGARGFYATPGIDFDRDTGRGTPFYYFTTGWAFAEVSIDRLTGELRVERLQALLDIGRPINPGIDRGQTIGGIVQGIGWVTTEDLCYSERGDLLSASPTTYKIPNITDLPDVFEVDFLDNDLNRHNVAGSKAVGEPPLMLGLAVWVAIKDALANLAPGVRSSLRAPATPEEILRAITELEQSTAKDPLSRPATATCHRPT